MDDRSIALDSLRLGVGHRLRDGFELAGELDVASFDGAAEPSGGESDAAGLGGSVLLRWHALHGARWSAFLELGLGLLVTDEPFPEGGTRLNGARQVGAGVSLGLTGPWSLTLGVRQQHVSNGRGLTEDNPSWEGLGAYVGLLLDASAREGVTPPVRLFVPTEAWPWSLRVEGRVGELGDATSGGGQIALDGNLRGPLFGQLRSSLDEVDGEDLRDLGAALYLRGARGLLGLAYDRQELDVFADDEVTLFGEWYADDLLTVVGVLGHEHRDHAPDRALGGVLLRIYPLDCLQVTSGIVARETFEDFGQESFDVPLAIEVALPAPRGVAWSLFAQDDLTDESRLVGVRLRLGGAPDAPRSLRDLDRATGPSRDRP